MSEVADVPAATDVSAGTLLRRAREASGLHVAALAVSLKVPVRKLESLEQGRYEEIGDAVFIRALASSVCRTLKVDPQPVLERLPQASAPRLVRAAEGLNAPFRSPRDGAPPSWIDALRQPVPLTVLALLVGAVVIYFLPIHLQDEGVNVTAAQAPAVAPSTVVTQVPVTPPAESASSPAPAAMPLAAASGPGASAPTARPAASATVASLPAAAPASAAASAPAPTTSLIVFRTKGDSWVEVVDAKGAVPLRKIMAAGETAGASGALPLTVTIGRVDATNVELRGKPFNLKAVSKDNVARFEVK